MAQKQAPVDRPSELKTLIRSHGDSLSRQLQAHHRTIFPPEAEKTIRNFSSAETAKLLGIAEGYLRQLGAERGQPTKGNRRSYSVGDIADIRLQLDQGARGDRRYVPHRRGGEHLQVITVMNFKGGSGKTTTAAHLAQFLALHGYRTLAIDLDPQASLTALFGQQPELNVGENETLLGAIRYDEERRELSDIIRTTYFPFLDIVPANIELMEFEHETPKALAQRKSGDPLFFARVARVLGSVEQKYDAVVIDCPPQLGFLTLSALCAATAVLIPVHAQMLDVMSMCQFLLMTSELLGVVAKAGGAQICDLAVSRDRRHGAREGAGIDLRLLPDGNSIEPR